MNFPWKPIVPAYTIGTVLGVAYTSTMSMAYVEWQCRILSRMSITQNGNKTSFWLGFRGQPTSPREVPETVLKSIIVLRLHPNLMHVSYFVHLTNRAILGMPVLCAQ